MKYLSHFFVLMMSLMFAISISFSSFVIYNSEFSQQDAFSLQGLDFYVSSNTNSPIQIEYEMQNGNSTQILSKELFLVSCNLDSLLKYCVKDSFTNYMNSTNTTFTTALEYTFSRGSSKKVISLDLIEPTINSSLVFDEVSKTINLEASFSDNLNFNVLSSIVISTPYNLGELVVYNESTTQKLVIKQFKIKQGGEYRLEIESRDEAGNVNFQSKSVNVSDVFAPKVNDVMLFNNKGDINIQFIVEDETAVKSWQLNSLTKLYGEHFESSKTKQEVLTPFVFDLKTTLLETKDVLNNSEEISLPNIKGIEITSNSVFSDTFSIQAVNADSCSIIKGLKNKRVDLVKSGNTFSAGLTSYSQLDYTVDVECINSNYRVITEIDFTIDRTPPEILEFDVFANEKGEIEIEYEVSQDSKEVVLYRNEKNFNSFSNLKDSKHSISDSRVEYPSSYIYTVEVFDEARNSVKLSSEEVIPKKVNIDFESSFRNSKEYTLVTIYSETGLKGNSDVFFSYFDSVGITFSQVGNSSVNFEILEEVSEFKIERNLEDQKVRLYLKDEFDNLVTETIYVEKLEYDVFEVIEYGNIDELLSSNGSSAFLPQISLEGSQHKLFTLIMLFVLFLVLILVILFVYFRFDSKYFLKFKGLNSSNTSTGVSQKRKFAINAHLDSSTSKRISEKLQRDEIKKQKELKFKRDKLFNRVPKEKEVSGYQKSKYEDLHHSNRSFKKNFSLKSNYNKHNVVKDTNKSSSKNSLRGIMTYSHSFVDNLISKVVDNQKHGTKKLEHSYSQKNVGFTKRDIFTQKDSNKFKFSNLKMKENNLNKDSLKSLDKSMGSKAQEKKYKEKKKKIKEEKLNHKETVVPPKKEKLNWGNYLEKDQNLRNGCLSKKRLKMKLGSYLSNKKEIIFFNKKSQAALEFILLVGFLLTVGLIIMGLASYLLLEFNDSELDIERETFMASVKDEFELARVSDSTYYREIDLSRDDLIKYELGFYENTSYITVKDLVKGNDFPYLYDMGLGFEFNKTFFYDYDVLLDSAVIIINLTKEENKNRVDLS